jgi:tRNA U34 5-methylaminomethyl-2-thiouridine-forming methyltransferase MnmC
VATALAWREAGIAGHLHFTSFEAFPLAPADLRAALERFPGGGPVRPNDRGRLEWQVL